MSMEISNLGFEFCYTDLIFRLELVVAVSLYSLMAEETSKDVVVSRLHLISVEFPELFDFFVV